MKLTGSDVDMVESAVRHEGFRIILEVIGEKRENAQRALGREDTTWEKTNYLRGKLAAYGELDPKTLLQLIRHAAGGPDGNP